MIMEMIMKLMKYAMFTGVVMFVGYFILRIMNGDLKDVDNEQYN